MQFAVVFIQSNEPIFMLKRSVEIAVLSDLHLGSYACHAKELLNYISSIQPEILILNGDVFDRKFKSFEKLPDLHKSIFQNIVALSETDTKVFYIVGNHDQHFQPYIDESYGNIKVRKKLSFNYKHKKYWFFHGDVFDTSLSISPFFNQLGTRGYNALIALNKSINTVRKWVNLAPMSLASKIKNTQKAKYYRTAFEEQVTKLASKNEYDFVACGHTHIPCVMSKNGVTYLNSGDWVENLTALEFNHKKWSIYRYDNIDFDYHSPKLQVPTKKQKNKATSIPAFQTLFKFNFD